MQGAGVKLVYSKISSFVDLVTIKNISQKVTVT